MTDASNPAPRPPQSVEDNYVDYVADTYGYAYEMAEVLSQAELARQDELRHANSAALDDLDVAELDDLERWTVARARHRLGDIDAYLTLCDTLLSSDQQHPVVVYSEISRWVATDRIEAGRLTDARQRLNAHLQRFDGDVQARQLLGIVDVLGADADETRLQQVADDFPDDAEIRLEIAQDLRRFGRLAAAKRWTETARRAAAASGDRATLVDIDILAARLNTSSDDP